MFISEFLRFVLAPTLFINSNVVAAAAKKSALKRASTNLDDFISLEKPIALEGILANIGPDGARVPGAESGIVVASPSKSDPNCK